jgi:hypothetical protein
MPTRRRPLIHCTLSTEAIARLDKMATRYGETRSGMIERLVREAKLPRATLSTEEDNDR